MIMERFRRVPTPVLAVGDAVAVALFAVLGLLTHERGLTMEALARNIVPIVGGWVLAAAALRIYSRPGLVRLLAAWFVGVTVGVAVRAAFLARDIDEGLVVFLGVTLAVTGTLLFLWRGAVWLLAARRREG
jgi:hypothetical protein